jgi:hypothetical protein
MSKLQAVAEGCGLEFGHFGDDYRIVQVQKPHREAM